MRIAMWSGPRNLSTAMMYSFASRNDCSVVDEPFYAAYLKNTGFDHPMWEEIIAEQSGDIEQIIYELTEKNKAPVFYQKHMAQHMTKEIARNWLPQMSNVFLIRHPARVVASFAAKFESPTLLDIGFLQQSELFDGLVSCGEKPIVIDSNDILMNPKLALQSLCDAIGIEWQNAMLGWPKGGCSNDGVWAKHWYGAVHNSTGFSKPQQTDLPVLSRQYAQLAQEALPYYRHLENFKLDF